ncbi:RHS repeat-associated core domain-containing protein [Streptomyces griseoviridis]|uniref:RHS repeat-associated core domain-containing protein n=1 Tax=Streptomyces griseoviridis TaxID=45398 RepID=UPI0034510DA3
MPVGQFFTQATNFSSAVTGGVDARTGLFTVRIALSNLVGNRNLGPSLPLEMSYSPLDSTDAGFGQGISLGLSTYDTADRLLSLSTGEQYKVQETGTRLILRQSKLDTVHFTKDKDSYRIVHKSGDVEILTGPRGASDLKVPTALLTPAGHRLTLSWNFNGPRPRLREVKDETDTLLTVDCTGTSKTTLRVLPGKAEGHDIELRLMNGRLGGVRHLGLGADAPLDWSFDYDSMGRQGEWGSWLTGVTLPGGMTETAHYRADGHQFPQSAGLPALPYVYRFVQAPGAGQPPIEATFTYTDNNFLGGHSGVSWDSGRDNLYEVLTDYTYGSTESRVCGDRTTTITRGYDTYHLQTSEETRQNGFSRSVSTEYHAVRGRPFDGQPAQFQLPRKRTVTWTDNARRTRQEITETSFDAAGNPQSQTEPDGTRTEWTYYPASGSGGDCPPDPNGFARFPASVTTTPPATRFTAPVHRTRHRYTAYRNTPDPQVGTTVLKSEELAYADGTLLKRTAFEHAFAGPEFGRLTRLTETEYPDGDGGASYTATQTFGFSTERDTLVQTHALTTHDGLTTQRSRRRSRFTGRLWSSTDAQGNVTETTYDGLGRPLTHTSHPGTPYQARETHAYTLGGAHPFVETATDPLGNQRRESSDGAGRPVKRERRDADGDGAWHTVQTLEYDAQGRVHSIAALDQVRDGGQIQLTQTFAYDDWGQLAATAYDDGSTVLSTTDPVQQTTTAQRLGRGTPVSGREVTTRDTRGEPVSVARYDLQGAPAGIHTLERDGWGRVRSETDALGNTTLYDRDPRGRLVRTTLPDGTEISRGHAPFSSAELVTEIAVDAVPYGTRSFDGLGRPTATSSGGRSWSHRYAAPGDPFPTQVTAPDGQVSCYRFVPQLDNAVARIDAGPLTARFTHDPVTGALTNAEADGVTVARAYHPSGLLDTDTTRLPGRPDRTATSGYTVGGLDQSYLTVDGASQETARDAHGRVSAVTDPAMRTSLSYDGADRLTGWVARDLLSDHTLTTALTLDDFGREVRRTLTDNQGVSWTLTQLWQRNDLLSRRTFARGTTTLRDETFSYSARGQLTGYTCEGAAPPLDDRGNAVTGQTLAYDAYGNVTRCTTAFRGGTDTADHLFENPADPCQLTAVRHSHPSYPSRIELRYDAAGRLTTDDAGRPLGYDPLGRLTAVGSSNRYGYDPLDRLLSQETDGATSVLYYRGERLASVVEGDRCTRLLRLDQGCVAQRREGGQPGTRLLGTDAKQSVLVSAGGRQYEERAYTPYGHSPPDASGSVPGYDGERVDPALGWSHLGNGYRAYHSTLMRFIAPDSLSPFGAGGVNPYVYCLGDPVNRVDPSGHLSWQAWLGIGLGVAGLALTVVTGGLAIAAAGGVLAAVTAASTTTLVVGALGVVSDVTAIASGALEEASPKASSVLGYVSLGTGLAGLGEAAVGATRGISALARRTPELAADLDRAGGSLAAPEIELVADSATYDRLRNFRYVRNSSGRRVWLTEWRTRQGVFRPRVESALERGRNVTILSGTHGDRWGALSPHEDFLSADRRLADELMERFGRPGSVRVVDMSALNSPDLRAILEGNSEVVAAFCYSRNNANIRRILGLDATRSYVRRL